MLWTVCIILFALWALAVLTFHTMGGLAHILFFLTLVLVIIKRLGLWPRGPVKS